jgi:hypothetical protein
MGCRHDCHRAQVHDSDGEEDRRQPGAAGAAVKAQAQALSPGRASVRRQRTAARRRLLAPDRIWKRLGSDLHHPNALAATAARSLDAVKMARALGGMKLPSEDDRLLVGGASCGGARDRLYIGHYDRYNRHGQIGVAGDRS